MSAAAGLSASAAELPAEAAPASAQPHFTQLDGLRALAVIAVMASHWLPANLLRWAPVGDIGVRVFFTLSGFLITSILLRLRHSLDAGQTTLGSALRIFYVRRFLRIFPLYYLVLAVITVLGVSSMRSSWGWHVAYLSNVYFAVHNDWFGEIGHFWSLAVEEQFYLVWPLLVLTLPRRWLPWMLLTVFIPLGPLWRLTAYLVTESRTVAMVLTPACLDTLGMGALLAVACDPRMVAPVSRRMLELGGWLLGLPLLLLVCLSYGLHPYDVTATRVVLVDTATALVALPLLSRCLQTPRGVMGRVLTLRGLVYLGVISYGLYIYHPFIFGLYEHLLQHYASARPRWAVRLASMAGMTVAAASLSWFLLERPLNELKRFFPYGRRRTP